MARLARTVFEGLPHDATQRCGGLCALSPQFTTVAHGISVLT